MQEPMPINDLTVSAHPDDARVVVLTLNRPARRNAMSHAMVAVLIGALEGAAVAGKSVVIIRGAGSGFCAGSDIAMLARMSHAERNDFEAESGRLARCIAAHPLPVIAQVHGFAIGGGLTLAAACDIVVATSDSKWSLPEVPIGLFPAWGLHGVAVRTGMTMARRLAFGIDELNGQRAFEIGLVDEVADDPAIKAIEIATRLARLPREQVAAVKSYFAPGGEWKDGDVHANRLFAAASDTAEAKITFERFSRGTT
jgi:enoyl-CoA hydratase/carnithine racemase